MSRFESSADSGSDRNPEAPPSHAKMEKLGREFREALMEKDSAELMRDLLDDIRYKNTPKEKVQLRSGTSIILMQAILTKEGWDTHGVDGKYGPQTKAAVEKFQGDVGLEPPDGVFGGESLRALAKHIGFDLAESQTRSSVALHAESAAPVDAHDDIAWPSGDEIASARKTLKHGRSISFDADGFFIDEHAPTKQQLAEYRAALEAGKGVTISGDYSPEEAAEEHGPPPVSIAGPIDVPVETPKAKSRHDTLRNMKSYFEPDGPLQQTIEDEDLER